MPKVIGIDLGTTNSVVAVMEGGEPVVIANVEGSRLTPSIVSTSRSGERVVGAVAKRQAVANPQNTIFSVKRFMGRKLGDAHVQQDLALVPYHLAEAPNGDVRVVMSGKDYSPQEISAMVLQKLKVDAEAYLGESVTQAVVTVPAYFNDSQRQATKDAGRIAGLDILRIINEPTASALAYGLDKRDEDQTIAVYDLGGGTFDISILELGDGVFEVKATNGDTHLGGDDFDQRVMTWMIDEFRRAESLDLSGDRTAIQRVKEAAEKAKMELSTVLQTEISLPFITADASGPKHLTAMLSRAKLEQLTADLIERSIQPMKQALSDASMRPNDIDEIVLVGGQTRMPAVQEAVRKYFNKEPHRGVNPDEVVAIGAAIQAGVLSGDVKDVLLLDVTPLTLGIETYGGVMTPLIDRNTTVPTRKSQPFSTASDGQSSVEIHVLQGERAEAKLNKSLGRFELHGIAPASRGTPKIEVTFDIDANGMLNVSAKDQQTSTAHSITITASSGLTQQEIERMVADAETNAEQDRQRREVIAARNQADGAIYTAERLLREVGDGVPPDLLASVRGKIEAARAILETSETAELRNRGAELAVLNQQLSVYARGPESDPTVTRAQSDDIAEGNYKVE